MGIFTQFFKNTNPQDRRHAIQQDMIRREIALNRDIFGPVPQGTRREFFCLDRHTWVWYEEWTDSEGVRQNVTTRYVIRPKEILKAQNGGAYHRLTIDEAQNFVEATKTYYSRVKTHLYPQNQQLSKSRA
ncbi:MAG TPA: hypothetical protein PKD20_02755 [Candidatus Saccharibacteria bacterium]|jgi:hypothetical protein|nr:hypothetical protein [Candidatus Saccharibacteria bacterium]HMT55771.1 hypothetical protein [Candidatus Saccharibacteria bacterium]